MSDHSRDELPSGFWDAAKKIWTWGKRIASLEARVSALEEGLDQPFRCQMCGAKMSAFKFAATGMGATGAALEMWKCKACGKTDERWVRPK
jgi:transcription elongation factor Elf1